MWSTLSAPPHTHTDSFTYLSICSINICHVAVIIHYKTYHQCSNDFSGEERHTAVNESINYKTHPHFGNTEMCMRASQNRGKYGMFKELSRTSTLRSLQTCSYLFPNNDAKTQNMIKAHTECLKASEPSPKCGLPGTGQFRHCLGA